MDDEGNTRPNKFVRDTEESMKPEGPDFLKEIQRAADDQLEDEGIGGFYHPDDERKPRKRLGASELSEAEKQAVDDNRRTAYNQLSGVEDAKEKEEEPDNSGFYRSSLKERYKKAKDNPRTKKIAASVGKYGAITSIFVALLIVALTSFGSMSTQLNSWKENIYAHYGQNSAVINKRSNFLMKTLLKTERGTSTTFYGKTRFKIGKKLAEKLKTEGIEYKEVDVDNKKVKMLVVMDDDGNAIPIVADDTDLPKAKGLVGTEIEVGETKVKLGEVMTLQTARNKSTAFNKAYNKATLTVTGKFAGWFSQFGKVPETLFKRLIGDGARNQTGKLTDSSSKEDVENTMTKAVAVGDDDVDLKGKKDDPEGETDENGNTKKVDVDGSDSVDGEGGTTYDELMAKDGKIEGGAGGDVSSLSAKLTAKAQKAASVGSGVGQLICGFMRGIGAITATVGAIQTLNAVNYTSKYLELADKIKAQDSNNATNQAMLLLNEERTNKVYDEEGNQVETEPMATTASPGFNMAFSQDDVIDEDAPETMMVNRENAMTIAMKNMTQNTSLEWVAPIISGIGTIGTGAAIASGCNGIQIAGAMLNLASDVVLAIMSAGVGNAVKALLKGVIEGAAMGAIMTAIGMVVGFITPMVAEWVGSNLATVFFGSVGGVVLWAGAQSLMNSNLQMSTGYLPDIDGPNGAKRLFAMTKEVEQTEWAKYDQQTMSPFDTSSKYTFLGSIVSSLSPIVNQSSRGVVKTVSSVASLAGDSTLALFSPTASAADGVNDYELSIASEDNCPTLHSVGAEGIDTCHKYNGAFIDDLTTRDPDQLIEDIMALDEANNPDNPSFEGEYSDGNPKIKPESDLAKFIIACVVSDSQPGEVDAAVQGFVGGHMETGSVVGNGLLNFGVGSIPFVGDILDIVDGAEQQANLVWNTRQACTARTDDPVLNQKIQNYSTYNLDQRTLEEMGIIENNAVTAFLDDYYEQNPLDQTYEGRIARLSGQTKEQVEDTLAFLEYAVAVYNYDPSEKYAFGEPSVKIDKPLRLDHESVTQVADAKQTISNLFANIVYADVRNRVTVS